MEFFSSIDYLGFIHICRDKSDQKDTFKYELTENITLSK